VTSDCEKHYVIITYLIVILHKHKRPISIYDPWMQKRFFECSLIRMTYHTKRREKFYNMRDLIGTFTE